MATSLSQNDANLTKMVKGYESLILFCSDHPEEVDLPRLLAETKLVCTTLVQHDKSFAQFSKFLAGSWDLLKGPLRSGQGAIPWARIKEKAHLKELISPSPTTSKTGERKKRRRIVAPVAKISVKAEDSEEAIMAHHENFAGAHDSTPGPSGTRSRLHSGAVRHPSTSEGQTRPDMEDVPGWEIIEKICLNCRDAGLHTCLKQGFGACERCSRGRIRCDLKDEVNLYWKAGGTMGRAQGKVRGSSRGLSMTPSTSRGRSTSTDTPSRKRLRTSKSRDKNSLSDDPLTPSRRRGTSATRVQVVQDEHTMLWDRVRELEISVADLKQEVSGFNHSGGPVPDDEQRREMRAMRDMMQQIWDMVRLPGRNDAHSDSAAFQSNTVPLVSRHRPTTSARIPPPSSGSLTDKVFPSGVMPTAVEESYELPSPKPVKESRSSFSTVGNMNDMEPKRLAKAHIPGDRTGMESHVEDINLVGGYVSDHENLDGDRMHFRG